MKDFDIVETKNGDCRICIIFSTNYISPMKAINEIQTQYCKILERYTEVYFDFLLCSRNSNERYAKVDCTNGILDTARISYIKVKKRDFLRKASTRYYKENMDRLSWTYVDSLKKKLISKGVVI